jgi:3-oxoacyl-[acyl-carrier-protein] synthase III
MFKSQIKGIGSYLPEKILTNKDLESIVDTTDEWITARTGISKRHIADKSQVTSDLALIAAERALKEAGLAATDIDFIFFATTTPDQVMPSAGCILQHKLGAKCGALDVFAACSGFLYSLSIADQMIKTGVYKNILIVGAEILSRFVDYEDRTTCILFGDGAGAFVVSRADENSKSEILGHKLGADGSLGDLLILPAGGSKLPANKETVEEKLHFVKMNGREIFKNAVRAMAQCSKDVLEATNTDPQDIDWLIPHQANTRIIEAVAKQFDISMDKVVVDIENMGNTSSATIPCAMNTVVGLKKIKRGDLVMLTAFGGGLTSGSVLLRY